VGIVTEQRDIGLLGEHGDPRAGVPGTDGAKERSDEKDVPDGAEADDEDVGREGLGHRDNVGGRAVGR
jgi:hypothetical protein